MSTAQPSTATPAEIPARFAYLARCTPAQTAVLLRLADMYRAGEGAHVHGKLCGLQKPTRTNARPALLCGGGRSREGISLPVTTTDAGLDLVQWIASLDRVTAGLTLRYGKDSDPT